MSAITGSHVCEFCGKKYRCKSYLEAHIKDVHREENCEKDSRVCEKPTSREPFVCNICKKIFASRKTLLQHQELHSADKSLYSCEVCGQTFTQKRNLYTHSKDHHSTLEKGWKPTCYNCGKVFKSSEILKQHVAIKHPKFPCDVCGKLYTTERALENHLRFGHKKSPKIDKNAPSTSSSSVARPTRRGAIKETEFIEDDDEDLMDEQDSDDDDVMEVEVEPEESSRSSEQQETSAQSCSRCTPFMPRRKRECKVSVEKQDVQEESTDGDEVMEAEQNVVAKGRFNSDPKNDEPSSSNTSSPPSNGSKRKSESKENEVIEDDKAAEKQEEAEEQAEGDQVEEVEEEEMEEEVVQEEPSTSKSKIKKMKMFACCNHPEEFYRYGSENLSCEGKDDCRIAPGKEFKTNGKYRFCIDCWNDPENKTTHLRGKRAAFKVRKNINSKKESTVECTKCHMVYHHECALYVRELGIPFVCEDCDGALLGTTVDFVPRTSLDLVLEESCREALRTVEGAVISVISFLAEKRVEFDEVVAESLVEDFKEEWSGKGDQMEYKVRSIYVFQRIDGIDTPFLVMFTQEYATKKCVIVDYLDTITITNPGKVKPIVCEAILLGYYKHMASIGFSQGHLWAKPPVKYDGYVFHVHPENQRYLKQKELESWYISIFNKGMNRNIIQEFSDFEKKKRSLTDVVHLPIFKDSLWAYELSYAVAELKDKQESPDFKKALLKNLQKKSFPNHLRDNFYISFKDASKKLSEDPLRPNDTMDSREGFVGYCRKRNLEFSTPRRAKFAAVYLINHVLRTTFGN